MRYLLSCLLLVCAGVVNAQVQPPEPLPLPKNEDLDVVQGALAWLVGDHVKARQHFKAAAQRGHPLGQYNLAMMLLNREGGPCGSAQALALLHKAADGGVGLAHEALEQMQSPGNTAQRGAKRPFTCPLPNKRARVPPLGRYSRRRHAKFSDQPPA